MVLICLLCVSRGYPHWQSDLVHTNEHGPLGREMIMSLKTKPLRCRFRSRKVRESPNISLHPTWQYKMRVTRIPNANACHREAWIGGHGKEAVAFLLVFGFLDNSPNSVYARPWRIPKSSSHMRAETHDHKPPSAVGFLFPGGEPICLNNTCLTTACLLGQLLSRRRVGCPSSSYREKYRRRAGGCSCRCTVLLKAHVGFGYRFSPSLMRRHWHWLLRFPELGHCS